MNKTLMLGLICPLMLSACASYSGPKEIVVGQEKTIDIPIAGDSRVDLRIPVGEVFIEGVSGNRLQADMVILCADEEGSCARRLSDVAFVTSIEGDHVIVRTSKNGSMKYRDADVRTHVRIPAVRSVHVNMTAGDLNISKLLGCLTIDMGAGDVDVDLAQSLVASVHLDAGLGDASMAVDGRHRDARRALLVGAEMDWDQGTGDCRVDVDLQAGDIFLELTEG